MTERFHRFVSSDNGCKAMLTVQHYGGAHSRFTRVGDDATAHSWRGDSSVVLLLDCFYDASARCATPPKDAALAWQRGNDDGLLGRRLFSNEDRRFFWGPRGGEALAEVWRHYVDSHEKYERLRGIKERVDPHGVFSAHPFSLRGRG